MVELGSFSGAIAPLIAPATWVGIPTSRLRTFWALSVLAACAVQMEACAHCTCVVFGLENSICALSREEDGGGNSRCAAVHPIPPLNKRISPNSADSLSVFLRRSGCA